jgi:hypothetical protein
MTSAVKVAALIEGVLALLRMARNDPHNDPRYPQQAQAVLDLCTAAALDASNAPQNYASMAAASSAVAIPATVAGEPAYKAVTTTPGNLGLRIAELAAHGMGTREIARILGVNASTVSRRLRNT